MKANKYYILRRNSPDTLDFCMRDCELIARTSFENRRNKLSEKHALILIEKTRDFKLNSERITNVWTMNEGCPILWEKYTKKRLMWDYTGVVNPLLHEKGLVVTWEQYKNNGNKVVKL